MAALAATVAGGDDSLTAAIDDLIDEIRGLREDLRAVAKRGGLGALFRDLLNR